MNEEVTPEVTPQVSPNQPSMMSKFSKTAPWVLIVIGLVLGGLLLFKHLKLRDEYSQITVERKSLKGQVTNLKNETSVSSIADKVIVTLGATAEQKTAQDTLKTFYDAYRSAQKTDDKKAVNKTYLTAKAQAYVNEGGFAADPITCHQYSPMIVIGNPTITGQTATVAIQALDLIDLASEEPSTLSLVKQNSKWLIDGVSCANNVKLTDA